MPTAELARLIAAEAEAELRYIEALKQADSSKSNLASEEWKKAANAVTEFLMRNPQLRRER